MPFRALLYAFASTILICACQREPGPVEPAAGITFVSDPDGNWEIYLQQHLSV